MALTHDGKVYFSLAVENEVEGTQKSRKDN